MGVDAVRTVCWKPVWDDGLADAGFEQCRLGPRHADSVLLAFDEDRKPFRLAYRLDWDASWHVRSARLGVTADDGDRSLVLASDGEGRWHDGEGRPLPALDGCLDIDIWPTPFTNSFPIRRATFALGERREFTLAWITAPTLAVKPMRQAYTRLAERTYRFESLDGSGFTVDLPVDGDGIVLDYPGLFTRAP